MSNVASFRLGRGMSGKVGLDNFLSSLASFGGCCCCGCWNPLLFLNLFTLSRACLQGIRSSGELSGSPQIGQAFVSEAMRASRAHSSHIPQAQDGIMIASRSKSLQMGHFRSSGISFLSAILLKGISSCSQTGRSIFFSS